MVGEGEKVRFQLVVNSVMATDMDKERKQTGMLAGARFYRAAAQESLTVINRKATIVVST
jgi:hypothetical protein